MAVEFVTATAVYWASLALRTYLGKRAEQARFFPSGCPREKVRSRGRSTTMVWG